MSPLTAEKGLLEVSIMNAECKNSDFDEVAVELSNKDLPMEIITRLKDLWEKTKVIAGEIIQIGKIIIMKIVEFIGNNPNMAVGIAIGAAVGAIIGMVPFIGPLLQPLVTVLGVAGGVIIGGQMDRGEKIEFSMEGAIRSARTFFELLAEIFISIKEYWKADIISEG